MWHHSRGLESAAGDNPRERTPWRSVRATRRERTRPLFGDELIPEAVGSLTHGLTIRRAPRDVWPWLAQMGAGSRAGWYSYDWLDNGRQPSARRILPGLQDPRVGTVFPALPGVTEGFTVLAIERGRVLTLGWLRPDGTPMTTWTFALEDAAPGVTRLLVRARAAPGYRFKGLPPWLSRQAVRLVHFIMQRKQLLGVAVRAEGLPPDRSIAGRETRAMITGTSVRTGLRWAAAGAGIAAAFYLGYAGVTWLRYGQASAPTGDAADPLLDRFMPAYEVVEHHHARMAAPAEVTLAAASDMDLLDSRLVRAIFRGRELLLGAAPDEAERPRGLMALTQSLGWVVLAEIPGREVVVGAVTKPWEPNPTFRGIRADEFRSFAAPGYVKIAWTLRADPDGPSASIFRSETRVIATDPDARARFRRYWALLSPGIILIRRLMLGPLRADAERRAAVAGSGAPPP